MVDIPIVHGSAALVTNATDVVSYHLAIERALPKHIYSMIPTHAA